MSGPSCVVGVRRQHRCAGRVDVGSRTVRLHVRRERLEAAVVVDVAFGERHRMVGGIAHPNCRCITTRSTAFW